MVLAGIYAWATVAFGPRFSNLTNRGILTHGPYRFTRHPAYLAKNCLWWLTTVPVLTMGTGFDAVRATLMMGGGQRGLLLARADRGAHLLLDPAYRDYYDWMERNAPVPRRSRSPGRSARRGNPGVARILDGASEALFVVHLRQIAAQTP